MNSDLLPRIHHDEDPASSASEPESTGSVAAKITLTGLSAFGLGYMTTLGIEGAHGTVHGLEKLCTSDEKKTK
jgi:hypothetical protein